MSLSNQSDSTQYTLSGLLTPPRTALPLPAAFLFAKSSSCLASSALRSNNELALTPTRPLLFGGIDTGDKEILLIITAAGGWLKSSVT